MRRSIWIAVFLLIGCSQQPKAASDFDWPGVHLNRDAGYVELEARVSPRAGDWLELVACYGRSLEHESLVTVTAEPSQVHLALTLLGLEPGEPMSWQMQDETAVMAPATGAAVELAFVLGDGSVVPAEAWVVDQHTGKPMPKTHWVFAGSRFVEIADQTAYAADINGPVATLVHFGDEVLAPASSALTNRSDQQQWNAAESVPEVGTALRLRVQPVR